MLMTFVECGWLSWPMLFFAALAIGVAAVGAVLALVRLRTAALAVSAIALGISLVAVGLGPAGMMLGREKVDGVVNSSAIDPSQRERIRAEGYREAQGCVIVGSTFGGPALLFSAAATLLAFLRKRKS